MSKNGALIDRGKPKDWENFISYVACDIRKVTWAILELKQGFSWVNCTSNYVTHDMLLI